jgi:predicted kinase
VGYGNFSESRGALILLSGLPGTGKTTFARALTGVLDFEHVESDAIRRSLAPQPTYSHFESGAVFAKAEAQAKAALQAGRHALIDATNLTVRDRWRFAQLSNELRARMVAVRLVAPDAVVRERLAGPREGHSQANVKVYRKMLGRAEAFAVPVVVVDTRFSLGPALQLVARLAEASSNG